MKKSNTYHLRTDEPVICAFRGRNPDNPSERAKSNGQYKQRLEIGGGYSNAITSVQKDNYLILPRILRAVRTEEERHRRHLYGDNGAKYQSRQLEPSNNDYSNTIDTVQKDNLLMEENKQRRYRIRKLTPTECFRLMGVSDADIQKIKSSGVSESQQYKLAGNSIVVDCLVNGIFKNLFIDKGIPDGCLF